MNRFSALFFILLCAFPVISAAQDPSRIKDEMGLTRMRVENPLPNSRISDLQPMIAADFSALEMPVDTKTVKLFVNGIDCTDSADITSSYILYTPSSELTPGFNEVRITAKDVNRKDIEPLSWTFTIVSDKTVQVDKPTAAISGVDRTVGRLSVSTDYISAQYVPRSTVDVSQLFEEKEGMKLNADMDFTNTSEGRTLAFAYHRETQQYSDIELDKARLQYNDEKFSALMGHFWLKISDLTVMGTELAGARVNKSIGRWDMSFFSGRTQDPSTSGTYKQLTTGFIGTYSGGEKNKTTVTILSAQEKDNLTVRSYSTDAPGNDRIIGIYHEYAPSQRTVATFEAAANSRRLSGGSGRLDNTAFRATLSEDREKLTAGVELYNIPEDYIPVSEGSSKYQRSNRVGGSGRGRYAFAKWVAAGGEYEQYDSAMIASTITTKRGNVFITLTPEKLPQFTFRKAKLTTTTGNISESDSITATSRMDLGGPFTNSFVTAGWQGSKFSVLSANIFTDNKVWLFSFDTTYKNALGIVASYSSSKVESVDEGVSPAIVTAMDATNMSIGFDWNIAALKSKLTARYEIADYSGDTVGSKDSRIVTKFRHEIGQEWAIDLGFDVISHSDALNAFYNYDQRIVRTGAEIQF